MFNIKGTIQKIFDTNRISETAYYREFYLKYSENGHSSVIRFNLSGISCALLDNVEEGAAVQVSFSIDGNPKEGRPLINNNNVSNLILID